LGKHAASFAQDGGDTHVVEVAKVKRYAVVFALFILLMLTYIDRVCLSVGKDSIVTELNLSDAAMGLVFSAFALGYALGQIPSGWLADKAGPRVALAVVVAVWSVLIALSGLAWNLASLVTFVFLFGVSEAGAYPGSLRAICNWLPPAERGRGNGAMFSGSRLGAALSFPLLAWMLTRWQWRTSFQILGGMGMAWAVIWLLWFRNHPPKPLTADSTVPRTAVGFAAVLRSNSSSTLCEAKCL
jgi:ACS family glucarate transporter-like MFS transporter